MSVPHVLLVALGGAMGTTARYGLGRLFGTGGSWPWATFLVNMSGCLLMGIVLGLMLRYQWSESLRIFLMTGLLGGFTTFSAFSLEWWQLTASGKIPLAMLYAGSTLIVTLLAVSVGILCTRI